MKGTAEMLSNPPFWAGIVSNPDENPADLIGVVPRPVFSDGAEPQAGLLIALFRVWVQARAAQANPLPAMSERAGCRASSPELVTACQSLFELTEACIGRPLTASSGGATNLSPDEQGMVALLDAAAQSGPTRTSSLIPHGLPGALTWAAYAVNRALASPIDIGITATTCPFTQDSAPADR